MKIYSAQLKGTTTVATGSNVSLTGSFTGSIYGFNDTVQYSSSVDSRIVVNTNRLNNIESKSASVDISISNINAVTSSFSPRVSNLESKSASVDISISNINAVTASNIARLSNLETKSASVDISISNINAVTASNIARLSNLETKSSSVDISITNINSFTASNGNTSLNSKTGSYATTGSNTFFGTQTYSGSVYIANDLVVQGSSSIQYISASSVSIGTNIVQLNTANPSVRFAGLTMIDSGSVGGSGSFLYDSLQDEFIFVHRGNGTNVTSSHFVTGPETYDSLGNETYLTCNILTKGTGKEHLVDSCIFDNGTTTCIKNNLIGTGTMSGTTIFGSTITCSPIGCFATSCATAFIGGTMSGTTIYGSTAVCSPVGKFSGCVGIGASIAPTYMLEVSSTGGSQRIRVGTLQNNDNTPRFEAITSNDVSIANSAWLKVNDAGGFTLGQSDYTKAGGDSGNFSCLSSETEYPRITVSSAGIATFAGNVCSPNFIASSTCSTAGLRVYGASGTHQWDMYLNGANLRFSDNTSGGCLVVDNAASFSSTVTAAGYLISGDNALKLNSIVSVQSQQIQYQNNGTNKWQLYLNASDNGFSIYNSAQSANNFTIGSTGATTLNGCPLGHLLYIQNSNSGYYSSTDYLDNAGTEKLIVGYGNSGAGALASKAIIYGTSGVGLNFYTNGSTTAKMVIDTTGIATFACQVCAPSFKGGTIYGTAGYFSCHIELNDNGSGWIYGVDKNHSIILRGDRTGCVADFTNYYQYGGNLSTGKGHNFWTDGVLASQTIKMQIANNGICMTVPLYVCANGSAFGTAAGSGQAMTIQAGSNCRAIIFKNPAGADGSLWLYGTSNTINYSFSTYSVGDAFLLYNNGTYDFAGGDASDIRLKENITTIDYNATEKLMQLVSKSYNMIKHPDTKRSGFIAQEVKEVLPDFVTGEETEKDYLGIDYNGILSLAVKAIQEQQCTINLLKSCIGIV